MAKEELTVRVCDECGMGDAERYLIRREKGLGVAGAARYLDLCETHALPLEELLRGRRPRTDFDKYIATEDEVAQAREEYLAKKARE